MVVGKPPLGLAPGSENWSANKRTRNRIAYRERPGFLTHEPSNQEMSMKSCDSLCWRKRPKSLLQQMKQHEIENHHETWQASFSFSCNGVAILFLRYLKSFGVVVVLTISIAIYADSRLMPRVIDPTLCIHIVSQALQALESRSLSRACTSLRPPMPESRDLPSQPTKLVRNTPPAIDRTPSHSPCNSSPSQSSSNCNPEACPCRCYMNGIEG